MGESFEAENATPGRAYQAPFPSLRLDLSGQAEWGDELRSTYVSSNSKASGGHVSKQSKGERRKLKQRERRQKWRQENKAKKRETWRKILDLVLSLPEPRPSICSAADLGETDRFKPSKRHRLSPKERTLAFFINLFKNDTRPTDWDLLCIEAEESTRLPHYQLFLPLSSLSALVWETEYEGRRLHFLASKSLEEVDAIMVEKEREITFYRKHMGNKDFIISNLSKYLGKFNDMPTEHIIKVLYYGQLVLQRVIKELERQVDWCCTVRDLLVDLPLETPSVDTEWEPKKI
ncbi:hypothetical protein F4803DRAFT_545912 [Xylaria telfairii]|nr:hypothetical protein F4803DRAFT_545912 [Xylaria telfairii]